MQTEIHGAVQQLSESLAQLEASGATITGVSGKVAEKALRERLAQLRAQLEVREGAALPETIQALHEALETGDLERATLEAARLARQMDDPAFEKFKGLLIAHGIELVKLKEDASAYKDEIAKLVSGLEAAGEAADEAGKKFITTFTHDVEGDRRIRQLRSSQRIEESREQAAKEAAAREKQAAAEAEREIERHIAWRKQKEQALADELVRISEQTIERGKQAGLDQEKAIQREADNQRQEQQRARERQIEAEARLYTGLVTTPCCSIEQDFQHVAESILA
jgi:hypothetical protein